MRPITRLRSVRISTSAFDRSIEFYSKGFGLVLEDRNQDVAYFAGARNQSGILELHNGSHDALIGLTFTMATVEDLRTSHRFLSSRGFETKSAFAGEGIGFEVADPDGNRISFTLDDGIPDERPTDDGRPLFLSHVVLNSPDAAKLTSFFVDVLGFKIADRYEKDLLSFLRCAQKQHHCIGISPGPKASLNHFSVDLGGIDALMRGVGRMKKAGFEPIWGPGRHGPGGNVFCYYEDPSGFVPEFTCDVIQIDDEDKWVPKEWPRVPDIANVWGTGGPSKRAVELMSGHRGE
ncbi:VOC family protein [Bradyrhizobium jicamae]|uniref:VOC family protein n=1 Tax=Bradyrhizobium jicamae TaxID=280332 RepID=UPI001BAE16BA|nr:VOC family protein [Bradyrhizobium jicamae]MBR0755296.1 VOC family protein [Bradyrhizobium jicamae]